MDNVTKVLSEFKEFFHKKNIVVAFSGGLDSSLLLTLAKNYAEEVRAVFIYTEFIDKKAVEIAKKYTDYLNMKLEILNITLLDDKKIAKNDFMRCYYCKKKMFNSLLSWIKEKENEKEWIIIEGTTPDDLKNDYRPGVKVLKELGIVSPFIELNITKEIISEIVEKIDIGPIISFPTTCLATRIAYHIPITIQRLKRIERAEQLIQEILHLNFIRVRDHDNFARIEISQEHFYKLVNNSEIRTKIIENLHKLGFKYITLDLEGYIQGSMNRSINDL